MSWIRLDDGYMRHPKFLRLRKFGADAFELWHGLRSWCAAHNTDGAIDGDLVDVPEGPPQPRRQECLDYMVEINLLEQTETGYEMHDFLDWAPSKTEVEKERSDARERARRYRQNRGKKSRGTNGRPSRRDAQPEPTDGDA